MSEPDFKPAWWCRSTHIQTILPVFAPRPKPVVSRIERIELDDGDFLDLVHVGKDDQPVVLICHGLEGNQHSPYIQRLLAVLESSNKHGVLLIFRGCGDEPNRLARGYHSGDTSDINTVFNLLKSRHPEQDIYTVGYSLGGNAMLKWLAEQGEHSRIKKAVAVSVPFQLNMAADRLNTGFSKLYQWWLLRSLYKSIKKKISAKILTDDFSNVDRLNTFWLFDDQITARLHGFKDVHDYYHQSSCFQYLSKINTPTLIIHAEDDPFIPARAIPSPEDISATIELNIVPHGGHVGFINVSHPFKLKYWLEERILAYIDDGISN